MGESRDTREEGGAVENGGRPLRLVYEARAMEMGLKLNRRIQRYLSHLDCQGQARWHRVIERERVAMAKAKLGLTGGDLGRLRLLGLEG